MKATLRLHWLPRGWPPKAGDSAMACMLTDPVTGEPVPVEVVLDGPDADVQRILDLGLTPLHFTDGEGMGVRWFNPNGKGKRFDVAKLMADISMTVTVGGKTMFTSTVEPWEAPR